MIHPPGPVPLHVAGLEFVLLQDFCKASLHHLLGSQQLFHLTAASQVHLWSQLQEVLDRGLETLVGGVDGKTLPGIRA